MAERKPAKAKPAPAAPAERELTAYIVLRQVFLRGATDIGEVYDLPQHEPAETLHSAIQRGVWVPVLKRSEADGSWDVHVVKAARGDLAIDAVTGKGEDALVGRWKAVALSAWKGVTTVNPPLQVLHDQRTVSRDE